MQTIQILQDALEAEVGLYVKTPEQNKLRTRLYKARREEQHRGNDAYDDLSIFALADGETLYIVHRTVLEQWNGGIDEMQYPPE